MDDTALPVLFFDGGIPDHFRDLITTHAGPVTLLRERAGQLETVTVKFDDDPVVGNKDAGGE